MSLVYADSWTSNLPSHSTLFTDTITSKTDGSSVNIADSQGLFVTGDVTTLGKVGIGTTNPEGRLHVVTTAWANRPIIQSASDGIQASLQFGHSSTAADNSFILGTWDDNKFRINIGYDLDSNNAVTIDRSGNVGIGTTGPGTRLWIEAADNTNNILTLRSTQSSPRSSLVFSTNVGSADWVVGKNFAGDAAGDKFSIGTALSSAGAKFTIDNQGNVGIGTTGPQDKLHVAGGSNLGLMRIVGSSSGTGTTVGDRAGIFFSSNPNSDRAKASLAYIETAGTHGGGDFVFLLANSPGGAAQVDVTDERMRITRTGNIGIGTTSPARKLHISDAMRLEPIASPPSSPSSGDLYFDNSEALCVYVNSAWAKIAGSGTCA